MPSKLRDHPRPVSAAVLRARLWGVASRDAPSFARPLAHGARRAAVALLVAAALAGPAALAAPEDHRHDGHAAPASTDYARSLADYSPPDVRLLDMRGAEVRLADEMGHDGPLMLQFIFTTCPGVCPALSAMFRGAQERLGAEAGEVRLLSISIDPEHDTPPRLSDYAARFRAGPGWRFLTGELDEIVAVQKAFDAYRGNKMRHEPTTYLRASPGESWLRLDGFLTADELVAELRRLTAR